jgi:hypothetical protein
VEQSGGCHTGLDNGRPVRSRRRDRGREKRDGRATLRVSYHRGTEKNGVQRSEDLTVISQEIFDLTPSLNWSIDLNLRDWSSGGM